MQHAPQFALPGRRRRMTLSLAPLIDVTFILLIFFMLVTQYTRLAPVDVTLGEITQVQLPEQELAGAKRLVQTKLTLRADGTLELDGEPVPNIAGLSEILVARGRQLLQESAAMPEQAGERPLLVVSPEGDVNLQLLIDALTALEEAPMFEARIVTPGPEATP
jgi:biopolymer transport protein ExbD